MRKELQVWYKTKGRFLRLSESPFSTHAKTHPASPSMAYFILMDNGLIKAPNYVITCFELFACLEKCELQWAYIPLVK